MGTKIRCKKCGDVIESQSRHDLVFCSCGSVYIDGGNDYLRFGGNKEDIEILEIQLNGIHKLKHEIQHFLLKCGKWIVDPEYKDNWIKQFSEEEINDFIDKLNKNYQGDQDA